MNRMLRVNESIKRELCMMIERTISPELECLITVTEVKTSPDLRNADIYISIYGSNDQKDKALRLLQECRIDFQRQLAKHVRIKYTPVLHFHLDDKLEKADRIYHILDDLNIVEENDEDSSSK